MTHKSLRYSLALASAVLCFAGGLTPSMKASTVTGFQTYTPTLTGGTVANFEGKTEGAIITNQYTGMTFSQTGGGAPMIDNSPYMFGYGASSGSGVLTGSSQGGNIATTAGIIVTFSSLQSNVQAFLSDTSPLGNYTIFAYSGANGTGTLLDSFIVAANQILPPGYTGGFFPPPGTSPLPGIYVGFTDTVAQIASLEIGPSSSSGDAFAVDDVSFGGSSRAIAVTPEPSSLILSLTGMAGLAVAGLRRFKLRTAAA